LYYLVCVQNGDLNCYCDFQDGGQFGWRNPLEGFDTTPSKSMESKETQTERKMSCFRQFLRCVVADLEFRKERARAALAKSPNSNTNSVSRIDRISRVLFPVSFIILNIIYWFMYTNMSDECPKKNNFVKPWHSADKLRIVIIFVTFCHYKLLCSSVVLFNFLIYSFKIL